MNHSRIKKRCVSLNAAAKAVTSLLIPPGEMIFFPFFPLYFYPFCLTQLRQVGLPVGQELSQGAESTPGLRWSARLFCFNPAATVASRTIFSWRPGGSASERVRRLHQQSVSSLLCFPPGGGGEEVPLEEPPSRVSAPLKPSGCGGIVRRLPFLGNTGGKWATPRAESTVPSD